jgi:transposase
MQKKHKFSQEFKAKVALAALKGDKTTAELSSLFGIHANLINRWAKEAKERLSLVFGNKRAKDKEKDALVEELYKRIGQLNVENEWLKKKLGC